MATVAARRRAVVVEGDSYWEAWSEGMVDDVKVFGNRMDEFGEEAEGSPSGPEP